MKLLIIEDDKALNDGIALSFSGSEILQAYSLEEARRFIDLKPDLRFSTSICPTAADWTSAGKFAGSVRRPSSF